MDKNNHNMNHHSGSDNQTQLTIPTSKSPVKTTIDDDWDISDDDINPTNNQNTAKSTLKSINKDQNDWDTPDDEEEQQNIHSTPSSKPKPKPQATSTINAPNASLSIKNKPSLRSPICVVMGHVDSGKTTFLDYIRHTSIQQKEVGNITQQIGATYLSVKYIKHITRIQLKTKLKYKAPGLLFIDTPGHSVYSNLRKRGSSMCDIAILVVNLMKGLQTQTIQSLNILKQNNIPFIIALNKIDQCYQWKVNKNQSFQITFNKQNRSTKKDFNRRISSIKLDLNQNGFNVNLYHINTSNKFRSNDIRIVPISGKTGEGISDLLYLISKVKIPIKLNQNIFKCFILEVHDAKGYGTVIDVILINGNINQSDTIILCSINNKPIITDIKLLLLPYEAQETRSKNGKYKKVTDVNASAAIRIVCKKSVKTVVAGSLLYKISNNINNNNGNQLEINKLCIQVQEPLKDLFNKINLKKKGIYIQTSTLGSLTALISLLDDLNIPICGFGIGSISKSIMYKAGAVLDTQPIKYKVILAFNIKIQIDAFNIANQMNINIFESEIIYHLPEMYSKYLVELSGSDGSVDGLIGAVIFPCEMKIIRVIRKSHPMILGCEVIRGVLRKDIPICSKHIDTPIYIGSVNSIQLNNNVINIANVNDRVAICIKDDDNSNNIKIGKSFQIKDNLVSRITRESIDYLKNNFAQQIKSNKDTIKHLIELKQYFKIN